MSTVSLRDAKAGLSSLVDEVTKGEFVTITRHGKPVAAIVPMRRRRQPERRCANQSAAFPSFFDPFQFQSSKLKEINSRDGTWIFERIPSRHQYAFHVLQGAQRPSSMNGSTRAARGCDIHIRHVAARIGEGAAKLGNKKNGSPRKAELIVGWIRALFVEYENRLLPVTANIALRAWPDGRPCSGAR